MLSTILKSKVAVETSIRIMDAFVKMRKYISANLIEQDNNQKYRRIYELKEELNIENMIYEIRGKQVMLDSDLAKLYECKNGTKEINQAVKNNPDKFPNDFYFRLSEVELKYLRSKNLTANRKSRSLPYVFTEQGIAMLATVLHTPVAAEVSVNIMRTFVKMRKYISANLIEQDNMKNMLIKHDNEIKLLQESFFRNNNQKYRRR